MKIDIEHLSVPCQGEIENGDAVVARVEHGLALIAVIDGLGHGPPAAEVARLAQEDLEQAPLDIAVADLMAELDTRLHGTRGAAVLLCLIKAAVLEACSVGNVEIRSVGTPLPMVATPGIVGNGLRRLKVYRGTPPRRERFIVHTDGLSARFDSSEFGPPGASRISRNEVCESLMGRLRRYHDDATVLVADLENG